MTTRALGYWVLSGESLLDLLHRAARGEAPDILMMELYANSEINPPEVEDTP